jgi:hypothetical protein
LNGAYAEIPVNLLDDQLKDRKFDRIGPNVSGLIHQVKDRFRGPAQPSAPVGGLGSW